MKQFDRMQPFRPAVIAFLGCLLVALGIGASGQRQPNTPPHSGHTRHTSALHNRTPLGQGQIIGNKRSHAYHLPGDKGSLPAVQNRIYFRTEAEARAAGYHPAGSKGAHMKGHPINKHGYHPPTTSKGAGHPS